VAQACLFQRADDQRIKGRRLPRLHQGRPHGQHYSLSAALRFRPSGYDLSAMIGDKSTADVPAEPRSLVRSRDLLIGLVVKESRPESEKAAAMVSYGRQIAALNAAIEVLAGHNDHRADRTKS